MTTPTFADSFSSDDSSWNLNAYGSGQSISGGFHISSSSASNGYKGYAFGSPDDFVFDFDWKITNSNFNTPFIILSSDTSGTNTLGGYGDPPSGHKRLIIYFNGTGDLRFSSRYNNGGASEENSNGTSGGTEVTSGSVEYYRMIKDGNSINYRVYSSAADRTADSSHFQETTATIDGDDYSGTADYAYLHVGAYGSNGENNLDDFKFYSGVTELVAEQRLRVMFYPDNNVQDIIAQQQLRVMFYPDNNVQVPSGSSSAAWKWWLGMRYGTRKRYGTSHIRRMRV